MPHRKDIDEHSGDAHRRMLVDLLYGELDDQRAASAQERLRGSAALLDELEAFGRVREMMRGLPEEEPPAAVTAKLLHAAAHHIGATDEGATAPAREAPGREGGAMRSWLESLFRPVLMYPGLAAATSLMLVAGVAGVFYASGNWQMSEPTMSRPVTSSEPAAGDGAPGQTAEAALDETARPRERVEVSDPGVVVRADVPESAPPAAAEKAEAGEPTISDELRDQTGTKRSRSKKAKSELLRDQATSYEGGSLGKSGGAGAPSRAAPAGPRGEALPSKPSRSASRARGRKGNARSVEQDVAPPLKPVPADTRAAVGGDAQADADDAPASEPASPPQRSREAGQEAAAPEPEAGAQIRALHNRARAAAEVGDCKTVREIAARIRTRDSRYHRDEVVRDKALAGCLRVQKQRKK